MPTIFGLDYFSLKAKITFEYLLEKIATQGKVFIYPKVHLRDQVVEYRNNVYVVQVVS